MTVMETGETVAIAGAGMTGREAAFSLAKNGKKVTRIDMLKRNELGAGATKMNTMLFRRCLIIKAFAYWTRQNWSGLRRKESK